MEKNKYLGALHTIAFNTQISGMNFGDELRTIKQALIELQELEEENEFLSNTITTVNKQYTNLMLTYQEQKRVLDILFKKEVDISLLSRSVDSKSYNYSYAYVKGYDFSANKEITEEEYDLLTRYYK